MPIAAPLAVRGPQPPNLVCPKCQRVIAHIWENPLLLLLKRKGQYDGETTGGVALCDDCLSVATADLYKNTDAAKPELQDCPVTLSDAVLDNYRIDAENRRAVEKARFWLDTEGRDLLLFGPPGTGKTRLAVSLAKARGVAARYVRVPALMRQIKDGFNADNGFAIEPFVRVPLLVFDDLGAERPTAFTMQTIETLYAERLDAGRRTIFTSNLPITSGATGRYPKTLADQLDDARFLSRLFGNTDVIELAGLDRRLR